MSTFVLSSQAQEAVPTPEREALVIWFRAAEGCPDGASFLDQLRERGVEARLADAGDRVDFVVTLGRSGGVASGRLERQTQSGTIAIRQVEDPACKGVASALALTLALSRDPEISAADSEKPAQKSEEPPPATQAAEIAVPPPEPPPPSPEPPPPIRTEAPTEASAAPRPRAIFAGGVSVATWGAFERSWHLLGSPFLELEAPGAFILPHATGRIALYAGFQPDGSAPADVWLLGVRVDGCPVGVVLGALTLRPCAALGSGAVGASAAGIADIGPWLALELHGRVGVDWGRIGLEGQAGAVVPVTRYTVTSPTMALESANPIGFAGAIGLKYRIE